VWTPPWLAAVPDGTVNWQLKEPLPSAEHVEEMVVVPVYGYPFERLKLIVPGSNPVPVAVTIEPTIPEEGLIEICWLTA
jgi:hypothetical protein